jgi:hypothetical protein
MKTKSKKKDPCPVKAGQYYAAAYNGDNGDLIVGLVKSVRRNGEVILKNLLSGKNSTKSISVLLRRNKRITKAQAAQILGVYVGDGKPTARKFAVGLKPYTNGDSESTLNVTKGKISVETKKQAVSREELLKLGHMGLRLKAGEETILEKEEAAHLSSVELIRWITGDVTDAEKIELLLARGKRRDEKIEYYQRRDREFRTQLERIGKDVNQLCKWAGINMLESAGDNETHSATDGTTSTKESSGALYHF